MMFKSVIFVITLLTGASAQLHGATVNGERTVSFGTNQHKVRGGLDLQGLLKFLEDEDFSRLRGPQKNRRLQTLVGPEGETMTKQEIIDYFKAATGASGDGKSPYEDCKDLFESFDQNGDGFLSLNELASLFQAITGCSRKFGLQLAQALIDWYDEDGDNALDPDELDAVCKGDPHFVTWYGSHFSYHGACDLVLVNNRDFASGKGLDVHVRTAHMLDNKFSYVSNAAVKIGNDIFEVVENGSHYLNGILNSPLPSRVGGFVVTKIVEPVCKGRDGSNCIDIVDFNLALTGNDAIRIKVASGMVHVDVKGSGKNFVGSSGLMGTYPSMHHGKIARDGFTFIREADTFAEEWQVLASEPKLFNEARFPQHPQACIPAVQPTNAERRLSEDEEKGARLRAEEACAHVKGQEWEFCVFDVMATGDYGMAATIYG